MRKSQGYVWTVYEFCRNLRWKVQTVHFKKSDRICIMNVALKKEENQVEILIIIGTIGFIQIVMLLQIMRIEKRLLQQIEALQGSDGLEAKKTEAENLSEESLVINEMRLEKEEPTIEEKEALLNEVLSEVFS